MPMSREQFDYTLAPPVAVPLKQWRFDLGWAVITLVAVAAAAGVVVTARTGGGKVVGGIAFGAAVVGCLVAWADVHFHPPQLHVSGTAITRSYKGRENRTDTTATLHQADGADLGFVLVRRQRGAHWSLAQRGNPVTVDVQHFKTADLLDACRTRGWHVHQNGDR
jgi:hypothetical protein